MALQLFNECALMLQFISPLASVKGGVLTEITLLVCKLMLSVSMSYR